MPQETVIVYAVDDGTPLRMHSVDADEAVRLGDYTRTPPGGKDPDPNQLAAANAAMRGVGGTVHPELLSPEERQKVRDEANALAVAQAEAAGQPVPAPVAAATSSAGARSARPAAAPARRETPPPAEPKP